MNSGGKCNWNWRDEGFKFEPRCVQLRRPILVYRTWGGTSTELGSTSRPGICLSFEQPTSRKGAEGLFSVWEWGNSCRFVTDFRIEAGAIIFVGKVDPGDFYEHGLGLPGSQIFVERDQFKRFVHKVSPAHELRDDVAPYYIVPN